MGPMTKDYFRAGIDDWLGHAAGEPGSKWNSDPPLVPRAPTQNWLDMDGTLVPTVEQHDFVENP